MPNSGYCKDCEIIICEEARKKAEEEQRKREEEARRKAEEEQRKREEEQRKREEEARRKAEEEQRKREREARRKAREEARRKAEEEQRKREEEARRKAEEEQRIQREKEVQKLLAEGTSRIENKEFNEDTVSILNNVLKLANPQSEEAKSASKLLSEIKEKVEAAENAKKYCEAMAQYENANNISQLRKVRDIFAELACISYRQSPELLAECDSRIAFYGKWIQHHFSSFSLRSDIHFGDVIQDVKSKEDRNLLLQESDNSHLVFLGGISVIPGGKTYYSFDENGFLKGMSYAYYSIPRDESFLNRNSQLSELGNRLFSGLNEKYGNLTYCRDPLYRHSFINIGREYSDLVYNALQFSGSTIWEHFKLLSKTDANMMGITVSDASKVNAPSDLNFNDIIILGDPNKSSYAWVVPIEENYVVVRLNVGCVYKTVLDRNDRPITVAGPFWYPDQPDYCVLTSKYNNLSLEFVDVTYAAYTKEEFDQIMNNQKTQEEIVRRKVEEKKTKLIDEL